MTPTQTQSEPQAQKISHRDTMLVEMLMLAGTFLIAHADGQDGKALRSAQAFGNKLDEYLERNTQ